MRITISGTPGSGKNTVADIVAKKLRLKRYSVGGFMRKRAAAEGLAITEYIKRGEKDSSIDKNADEWQKKLDKKDNFVIDGRLSYHFIPKSTKIFLETTLEEGAKRIFKDKKRKEKYEGIEEAKKHILKRVNSELKCYKKYYNLNPYKEENYDLVIDTTNITAEQAAQKIISFLKHQQL